MPKAMPLSSDNTGPENPNGSQSLESLVGEAQKEAKTREDMGTDEVVMAPVLVRVT